MRASNLARSAKCFVISRLERCYASSLPSLKRSRAIEGFDCPQESLFVRSEAFIVAIIMAIIVVFVKITEYALR